MKIAKHLKEMFLPPSRKELREAFPITTCIAPQLMHPKRVLMVDDNDLDTELFGVLVREFNMMLITAKSIAAAKEVLFVNQEHQPFDIVILDVRLRDGNGIDDLYRHIHPRWPRMRVIILSGYIQDSLRDQVESIGPARLHSKDIFMNLPFLRELLVQMGVFHMRPPTALADSASGI